MSCSKPLPPFVCDSLYYLNRDRLERFSIVCRQLKNFIERYLHSKPYRVFGCLHICGGSYALVHNGVQWHSNRDNYSAQQFLGIRNILLNSFHPNLPMSCSKPLPPFVHDSLYYLNRDRLERVSIVCRPLKNFIDRYLHSKPYRVFGCFHICGGSYALVHNNVRWHPNRDDYSAQQFLAGEELHNCRKYYSFDEMHPYLGLTVRIERTWIHLENGTTYDPEHIVEMESISHLWCDRKVIVSKSYSKIVADDIQLILNSATILQCRLLYMSRAHFSFKDYKVLYNAKIIENYYDDKTDSDYWPQFLEQPGVKPLVALLGLSPKSINNVVDQLSKAFSSAISPNTFKIVFASYRKELTEFQKANETSGEKLELNKGLPTGYQNKYLNGHFKYTLERSSI